MSHERPRFRLFLVGLALVCILFPEVAASGNQIRSSPVHYGSRIWQTDDGLPQNTVQALVQTRDGYLWIGTQNGLARFDGARFVVFDAKNTPGLGSSQIYALAQDNHDSLWIGTFNAGLSRLSQGRFETFTEKNGLVCNAVRTIYAARNGVVWIGTTNGLARYENGTFTRLTTADGLAHNIVRTIAEMSDGVIVIGTAKGVNRIVEGRIELAYAGLPGSVIRSLIFDRKGAAWVGFAGGVVRIADGRIEDTIATNGLADNLVNAIFEDRHEQIWVGTYGGVSRLSGTNWVFEKTAEGAAFDAVNCLVEDREGHIWLGTKDGLVRLHRQWFKAVTVRDGLTHNNTVTVFEDRLGSIWTGTWGGGLNRIRDGIEVFNFQKGLSKDQVLALHEDRAGSLWVGTDFEGGLNRITGNVISQFTRTNGLAGSTIRVLHPDRGGRLLIGTTQGLVIFEDGHFCRVTTSDGLSGNNIRTMCEDRDGSVWIGSNDGLDCLKDGRIIKPATPIPLPAKTVVSLMNDSAGALWIGTIGGGLCRFQGGKLTVYNTGKGLFSDDIHEILEDDFGFLWMSCRYGVFRIRKSDFSDLDSGKVARVISQNFGRRDGLPSLECSVVAKPGAYKARDGRLWFATAKGLAVVDPSFEISGNQTPPPVMIEEVIADKRRAPRLNPRSVSDGDATASVEFAPGRGELEIHYTGLSFAEPEKNQFRYKLHGFDSDWVEPGPRRVAFYNYVPPGNYEFHVLACNNDGTWSPAGAKVKILLRPHFWQMVWFKSSVAVGFLGVIGWGVHSFSVRRLERKMSQLERQTALANERSRIARDMHDDLGARLTQIMLLSDVVEKSSDAGPHTKSHVNKIASVSREVVQNLDAIVWAVDPGNDTLDHLAFYLHDYVDRYLSTAGIQGRFDICRQLPGQMIPSDVRHNLFMVVKEALNNAVKYSRGNEVTFILQFNGGELLILIVDNGEGFAHDTARPTGNGLQNMADRMKRIGGRFELKSEPGNGTQIRLCIPITP